MSNWEIRIAKEEELDRLVDIWLEGSLKAHDFIDAAHWQENREAMRGLYLPLSNNFVVLEKGEIIGFLSLMGDYIAALFVLPDYQRKGYGKLLLDFAKGMNTRLQLKVYKKNKAACAFYEKHDFHLINRTVDEATGEEEWVLVWHALS